ncbi:MAG: putative rane protein [Nevskia sp.]|nr:putative rane protein [Nevskia sp.]
MQLKHHYGRILRRLAIAIFFVAVAVLLYMRARAIDWGKVLQSLRHFEPSTIALAAAAALASYLVYACVDLFARAYTGKAIPRLLSMQIAFVSYAFNLNLGSLIGSIGFRYRLYSRFGVQPELIGRIVGLSLVTNWSGYFLVAGVAFLLRFVQLPAHWDLGTLGLQVCGAMLLITICGYVALCAFSKRRSWTIRKTELNLPSATTALAQIGLSSLNWLLIGSVLFVLFEGRVDYPTVLAVFLLSSIAGAATHIPAGLGVTEAVFISLLGSRMPHHELLAAILAYRGIYYLGPLVLAFFLYLGLEARARRIGLPDLADAADAATSKSRVQDSARTITQS